MNEKKIKDFAKDTLGCQCSDDVFSYIHDSDNYPLDQYTLKKRINIGNRLLILITDYEDIQNENVFLSIIRAGKEERDSQGFNRLRVAVFCDNPVQVLDELSGLFNSLTFIDDKIHLHVLDKNSEDFNSMFR